MNSVSLPPVIVVTSPDATSTTKMEDRPSMSWLRPRSAANAIRVPSGDHAGDVSGVGPATSGLAVAGGHVDEPQVAVRVVDEAGAVELVAEAIEVAVVRPRGLAGLGLGEPAPAALLLGTGRAERARENGERRAVGRPGEIGHAARQVREAARLATRERQQVDLGRVVALLGVGRAVGLLLDEQAAVREEREGRPVRREARVVVHSRPEGEAPGGRGAVDRGRPDGLAVAVVSRDSRP